MARAEITRVALSPFVGKTFSGTPASDALDAGDAANNHYFQNSGTELIYVDNTGAGTRDITFYEADATTTHVHTMAAGESALFGPFPVDYFNTKYEVDTNEVGVDVEHAELEILCFDMGVKRAYPSTIHIGPTS